MTQPARRPWTVEEFLEWERAQPDRYEYVGSMIRMMTGASLDHATLKGNTYSLLRAAIAGGSCRAWVDGPKVVVAGAVLYPDVVVSCAPAPPRGDHVPHPTVLVEVLSPSTEAFDRGPKWEAYQGLASLQHYLLVAQERMRVDLYSRADKGWVYEVLEGAEASFELPAIRARVRLADLYEGASITLDVQ